MSTINTSQTMLGRQALSLAKLIDAQQPAPVAQTPAATTSTPVAINGDGYSASTTPTGMTAARELDEVLGQIRAQMGQPAVDQLMTELPRSALQALEAIRGDLPIKPGESPLLAYRHCFERMAGLEETVRKNSWSVIGVGKDAQTHYGLNEDFKLLSSLQTWSSEPDFRAHHQNLSEEQITNIMARARNAAEIINTRLKDAFPNWPEENLLAGPFMEGPGKRLGKTHMGMSCRDVENIIRSNMTEYVQLQKEMAALKGHLLQLTRLDATGLAQMKTELMNPDLTPGDLYKEATAIILGQVESSCISEIKREVVEGSTKGSVTTSGSVSTDDWKGGGLTYSESRISANSTGEVLNLGARSYKVPCTALENLDAYDRAKVIQDYLAGRILSPFDLGLLLDRLLAARRIYEAMMQRAPNSKETQALSMWMNEASFHVALNKDNLISYNTATMDFTMANLRPAVVKLAESGWYSEPAAALVKEELALGTGRGGSKLKSLGGLNSI